MLIVNDQALTTGQIVRYLQNAGKLQPFIVDVMRQYILDTTFRAHPELQVSAEGLQQAIMDFRLQRGLGEQPLFDQWLVSSGINYETFQSQMIGYLMQENLKTNLATPHLEDYFKQRKPVYDQVVLSRIVVQEKEVADSIFKKIVEDHSSFEQLAKEFSISNDKNFNGMMGAISFATLPEAVKEAIEKGQIGDIIGPFEIEGYWSIFRFEQLISVSLDDPAIKARVQNEIFDRWIGEEMQKLQVKLEVQG